MQRTKSSVILYSLLGTGVSLGFLGHGIFGAKAKDSFLELLTGTYDNLLGGTMSKGTATTIVNVIGWVDIVLAIAFAGLVVAAITHKAIAYSTPAMVLFGWATLWGFLTALSRFTATLDGLETWDVVERGPNYFAPAGLVYLIYRIRKAEAAASPAEPILEMDIRQNGRSGRFDRDRELVNS
jgi:hypothetical protein